jgi:hypothetical protein
MGISLTFPSNPTTEDKLRRSAHRSVTELEDDIRKWMNEWNKDPHAVHLNEVSRRHPGDRCRILPANY